MNKTRRWTLGMTALSALTAVLVLVGCGQDPISSVAPGGNGNDPGSLKYVLDNYGDPFAADSTSNNSGLTPLGKTFKIRLDGDSALMGVDGGTLEMQMRDFKSKLKIPKNALSSDNLMTVQSVLFSTPFGDVLLYDFGPDGLVFNLPAALEVDAGQLKDGTPFSLFWWNPLTDTWEFQQEVVVKGHKIEYEIHHFSKYGISAR